MLNPAFAALTEQDYIRNRGLSASTFIAQPFWKDLQEFMAQQERSKLQAMEDAKHADERIKANLMDRWLITKELVARIEQFPLSAIEAARELGGESGRREEV